MNLKIIRRFVFLFAIAALVVFLDQFSKAYVRSHLGLYEVWAPWEWMMPYARFVYVVNTGVAFGMLQNMNTVFAILAIIVSGAIIYYYPHVPEADWALRTAMGLQLGGALGNLVDRLTQGHVTDFISVGNFAVFNIADASISVGVAVLVLGVWLQERREKKIKAEGALEAEVTPPSNGEPPDNQPSFPNETQDSR